MREKQQKIIKVGIFQKKTPFLPLKKNTFFVLALILEFMSDRYVAASSPVCLDPSGNLNLRVSIKIPSR